MLRLLKDRTAENDIGETVLPVTNARAVAPASCERDRGRLINPRSLGDPDTAIPTTEFQTATRSPDETANARSLSRVTCGIGVDVFSRTDRRNPEVGLIFGTASSNFHLHRSAVIRSVCDAFG